MKLTDEQRERRNADRIGNFLVGCAIGVGVSTAIQAGQMIHCDQGGGKAQMVNGKVICTKEVR